MSRTTAAFILGPAGSGKTYRCIQSVRERLAQASEGPRLLFLAPKQATFQIESQILAGGELGGYTRLEVLSFTRLAERILAELAPSLSRILSDGGRVMVLRSLLNKHAERLRAFRPVASFPALAQEVAALLQELGRQQMAGGQLAQLKECSRLSPALRDKLHDLALLSDCYREWLQQAGLKDADFLLELATEQLRSLPPKPAGSAIFAPAELWLDGFGEMASQELALLAAVVQRSRRANLLFCVKPEKPDDPSWLNPWAAIEETYRRCRRHIEELPGVKIETVRLARNPERSRFAASRPLQHLEAFWTAPRPLPVDESPPEGIAITVCPDREAEAVHAARVILRTVREEGIRFRQTAVIVRQLEDYATDIQRIFSRYQIPHFIDQRNPIRHHPAVLLTQSALQLLAFGWQNDDWFAALKTQLIHNNIERTLQLENAALEFGIDGRQWRQPLTPQTCPHPLVKLLERHRQSAIAPFEEFESQLFTAETDRNKPVSGAQLAKALRRFWERISLAETLEVWDQQAGAKALKAGGSPLLIHAAAQQQLEDWLENVQLAFADMRRPLRDWLAILESGLSNLAVGAIPPNADQVIVGAVDRMRNPEIELALLLGLNESVFPARPRRHPLLTETDRKQLEPFASHWLLPVKRRLAREQFYAYIACTRPRKKLAVSCAEQDAEGQPLNPSSIITRLRRLFPSVTIQRFQNRLPLHATEHRSELIQPLCHALAARTEDSAVEQLFNSLDADPSNPQPALPAEVGSEQLSPAIAAILYAGETDTIHSSTSRLEDFAACPFSFFLRSGLKATERAQSQLDVKTLGAFQHQVLEQFHRQTQAQGKQWRDLAPGEARKHIAQIAGDTAAQFYRSIFQKTETARLALETIVEKLQEFIAVFIQGMRHYNFNPHTVELAFGSENDSAGSWNIPLDHNARLALSGKIDRLDRRPNPAGEATATVIIDYKSSSNTINSLFLHNGIQLQLFAYLNAIAQLKDIAGRLNPVGAFLVPLRAKASRSHHRIEAQTQHAGRAKNFQWDGCFNIKYLCQLDNRLDQKQGDQIPYKLNEYGSPYATSWQPMKPEAFQKMMRHTEKIIRDMGNRILAGDIAVAPYKHYKNKTPCQYCSYASVCRIDADTHFYRTLHY